MVSKGEDKEAYTDAADRGLAATLSGFAEHADRVVSRRQRHVIKSADSRDFAGPFSNLIAMIVVAAVMAYALELAFDIPPVWGYLISAGVVVPLVTHGVTTISRLQVWTQPVWLLMLIDLFVIPLRVGALNAWLARRVGGY